MKTPTLRLDSVEIEWVEDGYDNDNNEQLGCRAVAHVSYKIGQGSRRLEDLSSGGLYGITLAGPNDPYKIEVENEQLEDLREHLRVFGVDVRNFAQIVGRPALQA